MIVTTDDNHKDTLVCELQKSNPLKDLSNFLFIIPICWDFSSISVLILKILLLTLTFITDKYYGYKKIHRGHRKMWR